MHTPFTDTYDRQYLLENMMGPNAMRVTEEMAGFLPFSPGMRVLDLGCGMGILSNRAITMTCWVIMACMRIYIVRNLRKQVKQTR